MLVAVAVVVAAGLAALINPLDWRGRLDARLNCGDNLEELDPDEVPTQTTPWAEADLSDLFLPEGQSPGGVRAQLEDLPFGTPVSAVVAPDSSPDVFALGDGVMFTDGGGLPGTEITTTMVATDLPDGEPRWALGVTGYGAGGGQVAGAFVTLAVTPDGDTEIAAFDPADGERAACTRLDGPGESTWDPTLETTQVSPDAIAVVHETPDGAGQWAMTRLRPGSGDVDWEVPLAEPGAVGRVDALEDQAIAVSEIDIADSDNLNDYLRNPGLGGFDPYPRIHAYSPTDGSPMWRYPTNPDELGAVISAADGGGTPGFLAVRASLPNDGHRSDVDPELTLEMLDPRTGEARWSQPLGARGFLGDSAAWDEGFVLAWEGTTAYDLTSGDIAWELPDRTDPEGEPGGWVDPRASARLGERYYLPDWQGGRLVDPATGDAEEILANDLRLQSVDEFGRYRVLEWAGGIVVYEES